MQYKGKLEGFPVEVVELMLQRQEEQGYPRNISVFEKNAKAWIFSAAGFAWSNTPEKWDFWNSVIEHKNFDLFFEMYPKENTETVSELPKVMLVSDNGQSWYKRVVIMELLDRPNNDRYLSWSESSNLNQSKYECEATTWKFAKELPKLKLKLTRKNLLKAFPDLDLEGFEEE